MSSSNSSTVTNSSTDESILPVLALSTVIAVVTIIASGIISRLKSDLSKIETSCADCETSLRCILLPCACLVYFAKVNPKDLYGGFLFDSSNLFPLFMVTFIEPLGSALMQKFYLNKQKEEEVSGLNLFLTRLRLCSQSLAVPLGTVLGLELMYDDAEEFRKQYGIDFDATKMLIVFVYTIRGSFQRAFCRYASWKLIKNDVQVQEEKKEEPTKNSEEGKEETQEEQNSKKRGCKRDGIGGRFLSLHEKRNLHSTFSKRT